MINMTKMLAYKYTTANIKKNENKRNKSPFEFLN